MEETGEEETGIAWPIMQQGQPSGWPCARASKEVLDRGPVAEHGRLALLLLAGGLLALLLLLGRGTALLLLRGGRFGCHFGLLFRAVRTVFLSSSHELGRLSWRWQA
mgnify:CR=1 FL=1